MDLLELITSFRTYTKDKSEPYMWTDDDVTLWLNEAEKEAALRARLLFDKTSSFCTLNVVTGTSVYALDSLINEIEYAYLTDSGSVKYPLTLTDRIQLNDDNPYWRDSTFPPARFIQDDTQIEIAGVMGQDYTLNLEVYRMPLKNIEDNTSDTPEIAGYHHEHLIKWVLHRAYLVNDSDKYNAKLSKQYLKEFEDYFGLRPRANLRKREQANRPQGNKAWW